MLRPFTIPRAVVLLLLVLGPFMLCAQEAEKEAIKRVIMTETESYLGIDHATWISCWHEVPYAYWSFADKDGSQFINGWANIQQTFEQYFKSQKPSKARISYTWQEIRVYSNGAYVRFQEKADDGNRVEVTDQVRMLEKKDGKWKIICMIAVVEETE